MPMWCIIMYRLLWDWMKRALKQCVVRICIFPELQLRKSEQNIFHDNCFISQPKHMAWPIRIDQIVSQTIQMSGQTIWFVWEKKLKFWKLPSWLCCSRVVYLLKQVHHLISACRWNLSKKRRSVLRTAVPWDSLVTIHEVLILIQFANSEFSLLILGLHCLQVVLAYLDDEPLKCFKIED